MRAEHQNGSKSFWFESALWMRWPYGIHHWLRSPPRIGRCSLLPSSSPVLFFLLQIAMIMHRLVVGGLVSSSSWGSIIIVVECRWTQQQQQHKQIFIQLIHNFSFHSDDCALVIAKFLRQLIDLAFAAAHFPVESILQSYQFREQNQFFRQIK